MSKVVEKKKNNKKANDLSGADWTRFSISVWNDIKKNKDEIKLHHPAMFPAILVDRLIKCFTTEDDKVILDPFSGSGSTLVAANELKKKGIGFELSDDYIDVAEKRLAQLTFYGKRDYKLHQKDSRTISQHLEKESVDLVITSPPYWDILNQKRTADNKAIRNYGDYKQNLGSITDYEEFLDELIKVFKEVFIVLKPQKYCIVDVMDIRKKSTLYPFHMDLSRKMEQIGFELDDIIIWDRRAEYNNLRPLGYPYVFRVNRIHEFILIFKKH